MAAKLKKRLSKIENKILKLEKLELKDVFCSICQSILVEPVTLPCFHDFCLRCFNGSIENNALCCPLCRLRIGSWLRTSTKRKNLVNIELWNFIQSKFSVEIGIKTKGEDIHLPEERPILRLCAPGEIRLEYEAEIKRLKAERLNLEQKHIQETELLIKKIQQEEDEAHKKYLEGLKKDEQLAQKMQNEHSRKLAPPPPNTPRKLDFRGAKIKPRLRANKIDSFLTKAQAPLIKDTPILAHDTRMDESIPINKISNAASPEIIPCYGQLTKNYVLDKRNKVGHDVWNKENGKSIKEKKEDLKVCNKEIVGSDGKSKVKAKSAGPSLLVSLPLPYTTILQHKLNAPNNRNNETGSADSMRQELCYFKPIQSTTPTSFSNTRSLPLRVPGIRVQQEATSLPVGAAPTRAQYLESLCQLRQFSVAKKLPSAFVITLSILKSKKTSPVKCETSVRSRTKKLEQVSSHIPSSLVKKSINKNKPDIHIDGINKLNNKTNLRRTRSMGSISKDENETTPKKAKIKQRKVSSERKPYLRSNSKKPHDKSEHKSPPFITETLNNNQVNSVVKNLSSPLKNCDVKKILQEQLRIEKIIEQEKNDFELARKIEAEWNGRRPPRRAALKRQVPLSYALRPAKKLKV